MDVKIINNPPQVRDVEPGTLDVRQRRALARLGLGASAAYVAPTLLALRSFAGSDAAIERTAVAA